jgi:RNA polymerase sigma factor (sigma-70 family)
MDQTALTGGSVTSWVKQLQAGDIGRPVEKLWERYYQRLVWLARFRLGSFPRRVADEEDVALSAFDSFCQGAARGRFRELNEATNVWRLLVTITARKAYQLILSNCRKKRGGNAILHEAVMAARRTGGNSVLEQLADREPTPELVAEAADEYQRRLQQLDEDQLQKVAQWKTERYTNDEIAAKLGCTPRTVERRLLRIRAIWSHK